MTATISLWGPQPPPAHLTAPTPNRVDEAAAAFGEVLASAGFEPEDPTDVGSFDEDGSECLGPIPDLFEPGAPGIAGLTAVAVSTGFARPLDSSGATNSALSQNDAERAGAVAWSVDAAHEGDIATAVDELHSKGVETCLQSALDDALAPANNGGTIPTGMEGLTIDVRTESDPGIGDGSSAVTVDVRAEVYGVPLQVFASYRLTQVGDVGLVVLYSYITTSGEPPVSTVTDDALAAMIRAVRA